jgi:hypothetical protein
VQFSLQGVTLRKRAILLLSQPIINTCLLMPYREIIVVHYKNHTEHINIHSEQNVEFFNVTTGCS